MSDLGHNGGSTTVSSSAMTQAIGSGALTQRSTVGGGMLITTLAPQSRPDENTATMATAARAVDRGGGYFEGMGAAAPEIDLGMIYS